MSIYTNLSLAFSQVSSLDPKTSLSETSKKFAVITAVALAILGIAVAVYYAFKCYSAKQIYDPGPLPSPLPILHKSPQPKPKSPIPGPKGNPNPPVPPPLFTPPGSPQLAPQSPKFNPWGKPDSGGKQTEADDKQKSQNHPQHVDDAAALALAQQIADEEDALERAIRESLKPGKPVETPVQPSQDDDIVQLPQLPVGAKLDFSGCTQLKPEDVTHLTQLSEPAKPEIQPSSSQPKKPNVPYAPFAELVDRVCDDVANNVFTNPNYSTTKAFEAIPKKTNQQVLTILNELIAEFERRYNRHHNLIGYQEQVPAYFAQVDDFGSTNDDKKYLALVGIRNMLAFGPRVIDDFCRQNFLGGAHHYGYDQGPHAKGLNLFKYYTGTVVDLDTELDAKSDQEALAKARELIVQFGKKCGLKGSGNSELTAEDVARLLPNRKLHLPKQSWDPIPISSSNTDRSNHGLWKRQHPTSGKMSYFVNVPNCELVVAATLRFPYMIAELAWRAKEANGGKFSDDFLNAFFKDGLSTMCFNDKTNRFINFQVDWKAKFDGSETPEETIRGKIESGALGEELRNKGADQAMKEAFTQMTLMNFLDNEGSLTVNGMAEEEWIKQAKPKCIAILKSGDRWLKSLYRTDSEGEYFLVNESTLAQILKPLYRFIDGMEKSGF